MADPQSEALDLEALSATASQPGTLQCCCGNTDCRLLKHNCSILDSVEKDVHTAARLGQVGSRCFPCLLFPAPGGRQRTISLFALPQFPSMGKVKEAGASLRTRTRTHGCTSSIHRSHRQSSTVLSNPSLARLAPP